MGKGLGLLEEQLALAWFFTSFVFVISLRLIASF
jgi:hypothetical protein